MIEVEARRVVRRQERHTYPMTPLTGTVTSMVRSRPGPFVIETTIDTQRLVPIHLRHLHVIEIDQQLLARTSPKGRKLPMLPRFTENTFEGVLAVGRKRVIDREAAARYRTGSFSM